MDELNQFAAEAAAVDEQAQPFQPQPDGAQAAPEAEILQTPEEEAAQIVGLIAFAVQKIWPVLEYREDTVNEGAKRLAPLLAKYDLRGSLFGQWGAEIEAGMFFGGVAYASYLAVKNTPKDEPDSKRESWWKRPFKWFRS